MGAVDYHASFVTSLAPGEALERICAVSEWWTKGITGASHALGDTFTIRFGETVVNFRITEFVSNEKIDWEVVSSHLPWLTHKTEWTGTEVVWEAEREGDKTRIRMTHVGLVPQVECYERCEAGWNFFVVQSLQKWMIERIGMPDRQFR